MNQFSDDLCGKKFGRLLVLQKTCGTERSWDCVCDCGTKRSYFHSRLKRGKHRSCGCLFRDLYGHTPSNLGKADTPTYCAWVNMHQRCYRKTHSEYENYGGRGIRVCDAWKNFETFLSDMGERENGKSIDRINNDGNYEPSNCRWATHEEQMRNTRQTKHITFEGKTLCQREWANAIGIDECTLIYRLKHWTLENALTTKRNGYPRHSTRKPKHAIQ